MVLMVISLNALDDIEKTIESGTDDFLSRTAGREEVRKRVANLLELRDCV